jgi:hypothetical protein
MSFKNTTPLTNRLRSNRQYVPATQYTSIRQRRPPQKQQPVVEQNDVESLVSNLVNSNVPLANDLAELTFEENFLSNFEIEQVESIQPLFDSTQLNHSANQSNPINTSSTSKIDDTLASSLNALSIDPSMANEVFELTKTQKGAYKVYSMGYAYTVEKPKQSEVTTATKIYWRCESYSLLKCSEVTYKKVLKMLKKQLKNEPKSISCDFEKAIMNAKALIFALCVIMACYFHLCQSWFRRVQTTGLMKN